MRSRRMRTSRVSRNSWRWEVLREGRLPAMKSTRRAGSWMFAARAESSSERVGESSTTRWKRPRTLWASAFVSISCSAGTTSSMSSMRALMKGRYCVTWRMRKRFTPCTTRRSDPSGNLNIFRMWVRVPMR